MYLEKIEIQGFKSFAEKTTLLFNKELTAVVGPNGSGKSNIADSIRWVLGEQSLKLLRGKKSDDVIFAGSGSKGRLAHARVAIFLNNEDKRADIDYQEVVIERSVNRAGESEYKINGSKVRLTDVQLLLARAHVGQKSYSVIGQGMIDSLLTFSAQERRDFFDEATGVKQYQLKKQQAINKLDHTEENLHQAELVLQELEPRLRTLSRQVKRLERKEELEKKLKELHTEYYGYLHTELTNELEALQKKRDGAQKDVDTLTDKQKKIQQQLDSHEQGSSRGMNYDTLQTKLFSVQQEYNALTKKKIVLEGQQDVDLIKSGDGEQVLLKQRLEKAQTQVQTLQVTKQELEQKIAILKKTISVLESETSQSKKSLDKIQDELSHAQKETDWVTIEREAQLIHEEQEQLLAKIESLTAEGLPDFKEVIKIFSKKVSSFLQNLGSKRKTDQKSLWAQFDESKKVHEVSFTKLQEERITLERNQQHLQSLEEQLKSIEADKKDIERALISDGSARQKTIAHDIKELNEQIAQSEAEMKKIRHDISSFNEQEESKKQELVGLQKDFRTIQYDLTIKNNELTTLKIDVAKLETRSEDLDREIRQEAPGITLKKINSLNPGRTKEEIESTKRQLNIIGGIDSETVAEYEEVNEKHTYLTQQVTDLRKAQKSLETLISDLDEHIHKQFQSAFKHINSMFQKYFKKLFEGGNAKLILQMEDHRKDETEDEEANDTDEEEKKPKKKKRRTLDYSIEIQATPPGKKLSTVNVLSGGEKALTSISLICAIIANNPPPFVVLDEVDAALDEANSIRFAEIVAELTHQTQFITITHNRATMHEAKILYGVTMGDDGISRMLSVNFDQADKLSS